MHRWVRFRLWMLPILGTVLGLAYAILVPTGGLFAPWQLAGRPAEGIARIIGFVGGDRIFVETETRDLYSLSYTDYIRGNGFAWQKEERDRIEPDPVRKPETLFVPPPLLFRVKQMYETSGMYPEGEWSVRLALSADGNLWVWEHGYGGVIYGVFFLMFPAAGLLCGSILALAIKVGSSVWRRMR